jgi:hypothetical protein
VLEQSARTSGNQSGFEIRLFVKKFSIRAQAAPSLAFFETLYQANFRGLDTPNPADLLSRTIRAAHRHLGHRVNNSAFLDLIIG